MPAELYGAVGGAAGCRALATAFYAHVEQDPILRPLFPSTFRCAIEEFSAFLVQFLGGEADATQRRWWLSLRESHHRFAIGQRERNAWLRAMSATLDGVAESVRLKAKVARPRTITDEIDDLLDELADTIPSGPHHPPPIKSP